VAGPIYVGDVSSQLKAFIDRTYSWYKPDFQTSRQPSRIAPGKAMALILTQGDPEPKRYEPVLKRYAGWFVSHGFNVKAMSASGLHGGDVAETDPEIVKAAARLLED
jgi:multimeric flavodoxin WrbA